MFPSKNYYSIDQYKQIRVYPASEELPNNSNEDQEKEVIVWKASISIKDDDDDEKFVSYFKEKDDAVNNTLDKVKKVLLSNDLEIEQIIISIESHVLN